MDRTETRLLDAREGEFLLRLARCAIEDAVLGERRTDDLLGEMRPTAALRTSRGVFVTLKEPIVEGGTHRERLRGCIGNMNPSAPLPRAVVDIAPRAALEDPRFSALTRDELSSVRVSISLLTPMEPLEGPDGIVIGRDGVQLTRGGHTAVYLPQVAQEQRWDAVRLLEELARKAGLPRGGWRDATLARFSSQQFAE